MSIADPYGALSGPVVPGILDIRGQSPFIGRIPNTGLQLPQSVAQDLLESTALLQASQVTADNPLFARLTPRSPLTPLPFQQLTQGLSPTLPAIDRNYQRNLTTLTNKYEELAPVMAQLPEQIRQFLYKEDSRRVSQGTAPLTREETMLTIQTLQSQQPATEPADHSPFSFLGNIQRNVGELLHSIPRIPGAIVNELQELPQAGQRFQEARDRGESPLTALFASTPGARMLPGAFIAANIGRGGEGVSELLANPVYTALDILPAAHALAGETAVGRAARVRATESLFNPIEGISTRTYRPVASVLTERLTPNGELVRNTFGTMIDTFMRESPVGIQMSRFGGTVARDVARHAGKLDQRLKAILLGDIDGAAYTAEVFGSRVADIFRQYRDVYPQLRHNATTPADVQFRANLWNDLQTGNVARYDPGFVSAIRDLNYEIGQFHQLRGDLGMFDGEWYEPQTHRRLTSSLERLGHSRLMARMRGEYLTPSGQLTAGDLRRWRDEIQTYQSPQSRVSATHAWDTVADAYGLTTTTAKGRVITDDARLATMADTDVLTPRTHQLDDVLKILKPGDRQAILAEASIRYGKRTETARRLRNLANRKPPDPIALIPDFIEDARSLARRYDFETRTGRRFTDEYAVKRAGAHERLHSESAPARFHGLLAEELRSRANSQLTSLAELQLGRRLTPEEAARLVSATNARVWTRVPGLDPADAAKLVRTVESDVIKTWRALRSAGHDPVFVHKVTPHRTEQTLRGKIGVVPGKVSQTRERVLDLSPSVEDLEVSLTHQAKELIEREYNLTHVEWIGDNFARTEADLRDHYFDEARARAIRHPELSVEAHLEQIINRGFERFNPIDQGFSWGGTRLSKYAQDGYFIPKAIAENLHRVSPRVSVISRITDPLTRAFRYNVIGLSPQIVMNNFLSNGVAMVTEIGPRSLRQWGKALEMLKNPRTLPEEMRALIGAEAPFLEHLDREAWMATRVGSEVMAGVNAWHAFNTSAAWEAAKRFGRSAKAITDAVVQKSLAAQRWGDNVFRTMTYLDQLERYGKIPGMTRAAAENAAIEMVRRTFVDYASFTPVERTAMRQIIPFYSYMGHAARLVARYPLNHPMRIAIQGAIARTEVERLGALPGSFLGMLPIPGFGMDDKGHQTFINARPFDPFGDTASLFSVAGWIAAANPAIQTALRSVGVIRGESELYPTLRYDPETGRMRAVHPGILESLISSTVPRFGAIGSALGLSPSYNELRERDVPAANRSLAAQTGIPRLWLDKDVFHEMTRAELARQQSANDVLNDAMRSGDWGEALRYPSLAAYYDQVQSLTPEQIAAMSPALASDIQDVLTQAFG